MTTQNFLRLIAIPINSGNPDFQFVRNLLRFQSLLRQVLDFCCLPFANGSEWAESSLRAILGAEAAVEKLKSIGDIKEIREYKGNDEQLEDGRKANGEWQWLEGGGKRSQ